jgi:hypothetical protein
MHYALRTESTTDIAECKSFSVLITEDFVCASFDIYLCYSRPVSARVASDDVLFLARLVKTERELEGVLANQSYKVACVDLRKYSDVFVA